MFSDPRDRTLQSSIGGSLWSGALFPSIYSDGSFLRELLFREFRLVDARIDSVAGLKLELHRYLFGRRFVSARHVSLPTDPEQFAEAIVAKVPKLVAALVSHHDRRPLLIETWYGIFQWGRSLDCELQERLGTGEKEKFPSALLTGVEDVLYEVQYTAGDINFSDSIVDSFLSQKIIARDVEGLSAFLGGRVARALGRYCAELNKMNAVLRQSKSIRLLECLRDCPGDPIGSEIVRSVSPDFWRREELAASHALTVAELVRAVESRNAVSTRLDSPDWELNIGYVLGYLEDLVPKPFATLLNAKHVGAVVASIGAYSADDVAFNVTVAAEVAQRQTLDLLRFGAGKTISSLKDVPLPLRLMFDAEGLPPFAEVGVEDLRHEYFTRVPSSTGAFAFWKRTALRVEEADESKFVTFLSSKIGVKNDLLHAIAKSSASWMQVVDVGQELVSYFSLSAVHSLLDLAYENGGGLDDLMLVVDGCRECENHGRPLPLSIREIDDAVSIKELIATMKGNLAEKDRKFP